MSQAFALGDQVLSVRSLSGEEPLRVEWRGASLRRILATGAALAIMGGGIFSSYLALGARMKAQYPGGAIELFVLAVLCSLVGGAALAYFLGPRRPFLLVQGGEAGEPSLWLRREMDPWTIRYTVLAQDGTLLGGIHKPRFSWLLPKAWKVEGTSGERLMEIRPVLTSLNWRLLIALGLIMFCCYCWILLPLLVWSWCSSSRLFSRHDMILADGRVAGGLVQEGLFPRKWSLAWGGKEGDRISPELVVLAAGLVALNPGGAR